MCLDFGSNIWEISAWLPQSAAMALVYTVCVFKFQAFMLRSDQRFHHVLTIQVLYR